MSRAKDRSDEELMFYLSKKKEWAFNELYERYANRILLFMFKMLQQDEARAQDFTQDVFLKIVENAESFDQSRRFKTWIFTIAANICKNHFRTDKSQVLEIKTEQIAQNAVSIENGIDKKVKDAALTKAISKLLSPYRETFVLRYYEEMKIQEIASLMEIPEGTVKSRLFKATKILAEKMRAYSTREENLKREL